MNFWQRITLCLIGASCLFSGCAGEIKNAPVSAPEAPAAAGQSKKERIKTLQDSVFCISLVVKGKTFRGKYAVGTGFLVGNGLLASALHVQSKAAELAKNFENNTLELIAWKTFDAVEYVQLPLELFLSDKANDVAIFRFDDKPLKENPKFASVKSLPLAAALPPLGEEIVAAGYYGEYQFPFNSVGNVSMIDQNEEIVSDITIMPGNSGAPIVSLETGEVLGIVVSVLDLGNETVRFAISKRAAKLKELLQKLERKN